MTSKLPSLIGIRSISKVDLTGDKDPTDEDGDIGMGDSTGVSVSLGGGISSSGKKSRESNIGDSGNTRDRGKTGGGSIGGCGRIGYSTQLNELSSNHETDSENSLSIFDVRSSDEENIPENDRFLKNGARPCTHLYTIRNKIIELQTTALNTKTSETTGQTNAEKPKSVSESVVSNPKFDRDRVIIEDWNSDDEKEEYEVKTVRH
ncbi:hypothetical protein Tco_0429156 [Tanacetum coccineum]